MTFILLKGLEKYRMEFGSDYHRIKDYPCGKSQLLKQGEYRLYADGRQALEAILIKENINRIWVPAYYCHESLASVRRKGVRIEFYPCTPLDNPDMAIVKLPFKQGDALLRMNYFGLQSKPPTSCGSLLVIEDHSHSLSGSWVKNSEADWCFASLRKTLPIADGGIAWSPQKRALPGEPRLSQMALENAVSRYVAMELKAEYINGKVNDKNIFLKELRRTEENFETLDISAISNQSKEIVESIDIDEWNHRKKANWEVLRNNLMSGNYHIMVPEKESEIPFSLIILFDSTVCRDKVLKELIEQNVYPAILWRIPAGNDISAIEYGDCMLSIHCDARYTSNQMLELAGIINKTLNND